MTVFIVPADGETDPVGGPAPSEIKATIAWSPDSEQAYQAFLKENPPANSALPPTRLTFLSVLLNNVNA